MPKYIDVDAFVEKKRELYCAACERRMGVRNGHAGMIYEIGDAPCRACWVDDMLGDVEDFPAADVQKVVRCIECVYYRGLARCEIVNDCGGTNFYCAWGIRKKKQKNSPSAFFQGLNKIYADGMADGIEAAPEERDK